MFSLFKKNHITAEALAAYFNRFPDELFVAWEKDSKEKLIVGVVKFDGFTFTTQAKNITEFVSMVNEGVYIANKTPKEYLNYLISMPPRFKPSLEALRSLEHDNSGTSIIQIDRSINDLSLA